MPHTDPLLILPKLCNGDYHQELSSSSDFSFSVVVDKDSLI